MKNLSLQQYKQAIIAEFPEFNISSIALLGHGWANQVCLVNEEYVFRFPFDANSEKQLLREIRILPILSPKLPIATPAYQFISLSSSQYPYSFVGYERIPGESIPHPSVSLRKTIWWRSQAGDFLTTLHRIPIDGKIAKLIDGYRTAQEWKDARLRKHALYEQYIFPLLPSKLCGEISANLDQAIHDDRMVSFTPVILHQDFGFHNFLVDLEKKKITGVIDFGNITIGDPVVDISYAIKPHYKGFIDPGWDFRCDYYQRTGALEDLLYLCAYQNDMPDKERIIDRKLSEVIKIWS
jgi:aminoglycoside phosphotransferase (APT) family kinase protein